MGFVVGSVKRLYTLSMSSMHSSERSMSKAPMFSCTCACSAECVRHTALQAFRSEIISKIIFNLSALHIHLKQEPSLTAPDNSSRMRAAHALALCTRGTWNNEMGGFCTLSCSMLVAPMMVDVTCHLPCEHPSHQSGVILKKAAPDLSFCNMHSLAEV